MRSERYKMTSKAAMEGRSPEVRVGRRRVLRKVAVRRRRRSREGGRRGERVVR